MAVDFKTEGGVIQMFHNKEMREVTLREPEITLQKQEMFVIIIMEIILIDQLSFARKMEEQML